MYTSGTTGVPKGVLTTHANLAAAAMTSHRWEFDAESVSLTPLPMFHIGGIGWAYCGLWHGATTVLVSDFDAGRRARHARAPARHERRLRPDDPAAAGRRARRRRARLLRAADDRLRRLADHHDGAEGRAADLPLPPARHVRADRERPAPSSSSSRPTTTGGPPTTCCAPPGGRYPWVELRVVDPVPAPTLRPARSARCGCARRT